MIQARFKPMTDMPPTPKDGYKTAPFGGTYIKTLDSLERELKHLGGRDIIIEAAVTNDDIRNDGWLRSSASVRANAVRLSFDSKHGPLSYTCNTYRGWEANLRAISLTLERLRAVERYGAVKGGEQYKGWAKLPDASSLKSRDAAIAELEEIAGVKLHGEPRALYRAAAMKAHPDQGGTAERMQRVTELWNAMGNH